MEDKNATASWGRDVWSITMNMLEWMRREKIKLSDASMTCLQATGTFVCEKVSNGLYYVRPSVPAKLGVEEMAVLGTLLDISEEEIHWAKIIASKWTLDLPARISQPRVSLGRSGTWYARFGKQNASLQLIEEHRQSRLDRYLLVSHLGLTRRVKTIQELQALLEDRIKGLIRVMTIKNSLIKDYAVHALIQWCKWALNLKDQEGLNTGEVCLLMIATRYYTESFFQTMAGIDINNVVICTRINFRPAADLPELNKNPVHQVELEDFKYKDLGRHFGSNSLPEAPIAQPGWYNVPVVKTRALFTCISAGVTEDGWRSLGAMADTRYLHHYNFRYCVSNCSFAEENGGGLLSFCDNISTAMKSFGHFKKYACLSDASGMFQLYKKTVEQYINQSKRTGSAVRIRTSKEEMLIAHAVDSGGISVLAYSECHRDDIWALAFSKVVNSIPNYAIEILSGEVSQGWRAWAESNGLTMEQSLWDMLMAWWRLAVIMPLEPSFVICSASLVSLFSNARHRVLYLWCSARVAHGSSVAGRIVDSNAQGMHYCNKGSDWSLATNILKQHWALDQLLPVMEAATTEKVPLPSWVLKAPASVVAHVVVCLALPKAVTSQESRPSDLEKKSNLPEIIMPIADRLCEEAGDGWFEFGLKSEWNDEFARILADFGTRITCGTDLLTSVGTFVRVNENNPAAFTFRGDRSCCSDVVCYCNGPFEDLNHLYKYVDTKLD